MSKILRAAANDDYTLLLEFEGNHKILFDMKELIQTMPYYSLNDLERFRILSLRRMRSGGRM